MTTDDSRAERLRRLKIRCWRRGTKEMDLILGGYFDAYGAELEPAALDDFERLIGEDDQQLYRWVSGAEPTPPTHVAAIDRIRASRGIEPLRRVE